MRRRLAIWAGMPLLLGAMFVMAMAGGAVGAAATDSDRVQALKTTLFVNVQALAIFGCMEGVSALCPDTWEMVEVTP